MITTRAFALTIGRWLLFTRFVAENGRSSALNHQDQLSVPCRSIRFSEPSLIISILEKEGCLMTDDQREIRRKLRVLEYAELSGDVSKTCQHFRVGQASFYRWCHAHRAHGEAGLANNRSVPYNHPNKTPTAVEEKVLHMRRKYPASAHNLFNHERHLTPQNFQT
jgi:transposase-like protein